MSLIKLQQVHEDKAVPIAIYGQKSLGMEIKQKSSLGHGLSCAWHREGGSGTFCHLWAEGTTILVFQGKTLLPCQFIHSGKCNFNTEQNWGEDIE